MTTQLAIRVSERTLKGLDQLVRTGLYATRTEAVRAAIDAFVNDQQRQRVDAAIAAGYSKAPDDGDDAWLAAATKAMVSSEPW